MYGAAALVLAAFHTVGVAAPSAAAPRTGVKLGRTNTLILDLGAGAVLDTNPTNTPWAAVTGRLSGNSPAGGVASPGVGLAVDPGVAWRLERKSYQIQVTGAARAWGMAYLTEAERVDLARAPSWHLSGRVAPQGRLALDGTLDGRFTWTPRRGLLALSQGSLIRTTLPAPEWLGTTVGRTTLRLAQTWRGSNPKQTSTVDVQGGVRVDVLDELAPDLAVWQSWSRSNTPAVFLGGTSAALAATWERRVGRAAQVYTRGVVAPSMYLAHDTVLSAWVPTSGVVGFSKGLGKKTQLRVEGGLWAAVPVCPGAALEGCGATVRLGPYAAVAQDPWRVWNGGLVPLPVALAQVDHALRPKVLLTVKLVKDARSTQLYAWVDEKRLDVAVSGQVVGPVQVRLSGAVGWLSYGAPMDPGFSRSRLPLGMTFSSPAVGRQDAMAQANALLRWNVLPWWVLSFQQSVVVLVTTLEVHNAAGGWQNPSLVRAVSSGVMQLHW